MAFDPRAYARLYQRERKHADPVFAELCRERTRQWRKRHKEAIAAYSRRYQAQRAEEIRKYQQEYWKKTRYYETHAETIKHRTKTWRTNNPERAKLNDRCKYEKKPEHYKEIKRQWVQRNLAKRRAIQRKSSKKRRTKNPAQFIARWLHRRSLRKSLADGTVTPEALQAMLDKQRCCTYCHMELAVGNREFDHMTPLELGGLHSLKNLTLACRRCNRRKGHKPYSQWLSEIGQTEAV